MKRLDQLTQLTAAQLAQDDIIGIRDQSAGQTKYITVRDLTSAPDFGWSPTGESWTYSSWDNTYKIGIVTVPTDATVKYSKGMYVRFSQTTGGTKHGIIVDLTATTLTLLIQNTKTLANEAITSPVYSPLRQPFGFPKDPTLWQFKITDAISRSISAPSVFPTWYAPGSFSLTIPKGLWDIDAKAFNILVAANDNSGAKVALSTSVSSATDDDLTNASNNNAVSQVGMPFSRQKRVNLTAQTTYYLIASWIVAGAGPMLYFQGNDSVTMIKATSAYL